ncbi:ribonuclease Z [Mycobacterium sp. ML4]
MSVRELIVLGTASQAPTRRRNQNGYLLRWDGEGLMFDPGEGTQRQMLLAGVAMSSVTRLCLSHFHGDHCLGVPGIIQRLSLDEAQHRVHAYFPASGQEYFTRLHHACIFHDRADIDAQPVAVDGPIAAGEFGVLEARRLEHSADAIGYRLIEPDGRRFVPELLKRFGIDGPAVGELHAAGSIDWGGRTVDLSEVSEARPGQRFAFVMDTRLCDAVYALADNVDLLVIEATFLSRDSELAARYGHLTARQAARVAAECGVRRLVLTHFSQRYTGTREHHDEAAEVFDGDLVIAEDLARIRVPERL